MSRQEIKAELLGASGGGVAGSHGTFGPLPILVGPTTDSQRNTIRPHLIPIGCFRVDDVRFGFDSSFVSPAIKGEIKHLADLVDEHTDKSSNPARRPPASVFGHADPSGDDAYNKTLSGRRAECIFALLTRDTDRWEKLFSDSFGGDKWGTREIQTMLDALGHDPGRIDGVNGPKTQSAVKEFQVKHGLSPDGNAGKGTRKELFKAYMNLLCGDLVLDPKTDFLARGKDKDGKGDFQGCGEFNPILLLSKSEEDAFKQSKDKSERDKANVPNRRVMVLLFRPGSIVAPDKWPCPRAKEGVDGCKKRFFSDGDERRKPGSERRQFKDTKDTFACRIYQRQVTRSPCEIPVPAPEGLGFLAVQVFFHQRPMKGMQVEFATINGTSIGDQIGDPVLTDEDGLAVLDKLVKIGNYACTIEHQRPKAVCTVDDPDVPEAVVLPVGRGYLNVDGDIEIPTGENA
jgi:outer membrane protein OmpA-like peptidoglycan-associated protein